jgi:arylsulfate sulfotransferase
MKTLNRLTFCAFTLLFLCAPASATVAIVSFTPSLNSPAVIGTTITWTATATDSNAGPLTFQFNITPPNGTSRLVKDFNVGTLSSGTWTSQPFIWDPTGIEGLYQVQVVVKDFTSGETASQNVPFTVNPLVTGKSPVVVPTANPLVFLFSAPSCPAGNAMRAVFQQHSATPGPATNTNWVPCHPPNTMTFEIAGMYPNKAYGVAAQVKTPNKIITGPKIGFQTGVLPATVPFPTFTVTIPVSGPPTDTSEPVLLHNPIQFGLGTNYPDVATDLYGNIIWYYYASDLSHGDVLTRPLQGGGTITIQGDISWDPTVTKEQLLRQIDLAGNIVHETNMGIIQEQLLAMGAVDGGSCRALSVPAQIATGCTGAFHHDAIQTLPNGWTAVLIDVERIFPAGTQGDTSGLPLDVIGDMIVVLDDNWQVKWYWDSFDPANGGQGYPQLPVTRTAPLGETCGTSTSGCPPIFLLDPGFIAPLAHDWLHANTLYYWPAPLDGNNTGGDIVWSSRHQDLVIKVDYQDGTGTGNILWTMGAPDNGLIPAPSPFIFSNIYNDPWPWFSHQHDVGIENGGAGPMTILDNGDTRVSPAPLGLGTGCAPYDCDSRGMALNIEWNSMTITPAVSLDLGAYSTAMGSAELLADGNYFFENPIVIDVALDATVGNSMEIGPTPPAPEVGTANVILNLTGPTHYRGWQMLSLYFPPTT